jgi:hypothetical protein
MATYSGMRSAIVTFLAHLVTDSIRVRVDMSCRSPASRMAIATAPPRCTTGMFIDAASIMPVAVLPTPGPAVVITAAIFPVARV